MESPKIESRFMKRSVAGAALLTLALTVHINIDIPISTILDWLPSASEWRVDRVSEAGVPGTSTEKYPMPQPDEQSPRTYSVSELLAAVKDKPSTFPVEAATDRFGGSYLSGDEATIQVSSESSGYLYLVAEDAEGGQHILFPRGEQDNRLAAEQVREIGAPMNPIHLRGPAGTFRIRAIVTREAIQLRSTVRNAGGSLPELPSWGKSEVVVTIRCEGE